MTPPGLPSTARPGSRCVALGIFAWATMVVAFVLWANWPVLANPPLVPDDYRYLELLRQLRQEDWRSALNKLVVRNSWDHLWWVDAGGVLQFFRPTVVLSYLLDSAVWGTHLRHGLIVTNLLIHLVATALVYLMARRIEIDRGSSALLTTLFAALACHGEVLGYVAGRTDSLAAVFFLGALLLHCRTSRDSWPATLGACLLFALGLLTKELVLVFPLVCLANDVLVSPGGAAVPARRRRTYVAYGAVLIAVLAIRTAAIGSATAWVFPYTVNPLEPGFGVHAWTALRAYAQNLATGAHTPPFVQASQLDQVVSPAGQALAVAGLCAGVLVLVRPSVRRRATMLAVMGFFTWLPTSVVYVSERYLYLPSAALALLVGLVLTQVSTGRWRRALSAVVVLVWAGHQGRALRSEAEEAGSVQTEPEVLEHVLEPIRPRIAVGAQVLMLDFPFSWLAAQFVEDALRVKWNDPSLRVRILTHYPYDAYQAPRLTNLDGRRLVVERDQGGPVVGELDKGDLFRRVPCVPGTVVERPELGFSVNVLAGEGRSCRRIQVTLPTPLESYTLVWYAPPRSAAGLIAGRLEEGEFIVLEPPAP